MGILTATLGFPLHPQGNTRTRRIAGIRRSARDGGRVYGCARWSLFASASIPAWLRSSPGGIGRYVDLMGASTYSVRPLDESTWPAFAALVERNKGVFGGCWCM